MSRTKHPSLSSRGSPSPADRVDIATADAVATERQLIQLPPSIL